MRWPTRGSTRRWCAPPVNGASGSVARRVRATLSDSAAAAPQVIMYISFGGGAALISISVWLCQNFGWPYVPVPTLLIMLWYNLIWMAPEPGNTAKYIEFKNPKLEKRYAAVRSRSAAARRPAARPQRLRSPSAVPNAEQDPDLHTLRGVRRRRCGLQGRRAGARARPPAPPRGLLRPLRAPARPRAVPANAAARCCRRSSWTTATSSSTTS